MKGHDVVTMYNSTSMELMIQEEKLYPTERVKKGKMDLSFIEILMWIQHWTVSLTNIAKIP